MFKKIVLVAAATLATSTMASASAIDLGLLGADVNTLLTGVARDVAPSLRLNALVGDVQADADMGLFSAGIGLGASTTNGLGRVLRDQNADWQFTDLKLSDLINENLDANSSAFEHLMAYPAVKGTFGLGIGRDWDVQVSGFYLPQSATDLVVGLVPVQQLTAMNPTLSFHNLGLEVRRTLVRDGGWFGLAPALSVGAAYHWTGFDMGLNLQSLEDLGAGAQNLGSQTLDMSGTFHLSSQAQIVSLSLNASKRLFIFVPYGRLIGAYQWSNFSAVADLNAALTDNTTSAVENLAIKSTPTVNLNDFAFLAQTGLEIDLFVVKVEASVAADVGQAVLDLKKLTLAEATANALAVNVGFRFAF